jgi:DNA processing protein
MQKITSTDHEYPELLRHIHDPPKQLFVRGAIEALQTPMIAVVGSRKATSYGKRHTEHIVMSLCKAGFTIASGLAYGIDTWAHQASLEVGRSVAVLANGLNSPLMYWQEKLADKIVARGGAVISEFPPEMPALKHHFLLRNRIIAGLSYVTLVVEAADKSGALVTANSALRDNRIVAAIPGDIDRTTSAGCLKLLRDGALLVRDAQDLLEETIPLLQPHHAEQITHANRDSLGTRIVLLLNQRACSYIDVAKVLKTPPAEVLATITELQLEGKVTRKVDGSFEVVTTTKAAKKPTGDLTS